MNPIMNYYKWSLTTHIKVCVCCFWVLCGILFSGVIEVCKGCWVCDGLIGVLLSCIVGWMVLVGLAFVVYVVLKTIGVVTGGVA